MPKTKLFAPRLTAALVPVPERLTVCGLPLTLSEILSAAAEAPLAEGLKVTLIAQLAPAATELPQLLVCVKLLALEPETARLVMLRAALPELVRVIVRAGLAVPTARLPKARLVGERLTAGAVLVPVPERLTV